MRTHWCIKYLISVSQEGFLPHIPQELVAPDLLLFRTPKLFPSFYYPLSSKHSQNFEETKMVWTACSEVCPHPNSQHH